MIIVIYYSINILVIKSVMIACYNGIVFFMEAGQSHTGPLQSVDSLQHAYRNNHLYVTHTDVRVNLIQHSLR